MAYDPENDDSAEDMFDNLPIEEDDDGLEIEQFDEDSCELCGSELDLEGFCTNEECGNAKSE